MARPQYGTAHQRRRAAFTQAMQAGEQFTCRRCHRPILPGQPWDLGHRGNAVDGDDGTDSMPEHEACNRRAGQRRGQRRALTSRDW